MKVTVHLLKNMSGSSGQYLLDDEYHVLPAGKQIELEKKPVNVTSNISVLTFRKTIKEND